MVEGMENVIPNIRYRFHLMGTLEYSFVFAISRISASFANRNDVRLQMFVLLRLSFALSEEKCSHKRTFI